jgi:hypothetical protein
VRGGLRAGHEPAACVKGGMDLVVNAHGCAQRVGKTGYTEFHMYSAV